MTEEMHNTRALRARAVNIELERPVQTSGGEIPFASLVLRIRSRLSNPRLAA